MVGYRDGQGLVACLGSLWACWHASADGQQAAAADSPGCCQAGTTERATSASTAPAGALLGALELQRAAPIRGLVPPRQVSRMPAMQHSAADEGVGMARRNEWWGARAAGDGIQGHLPMQLPRLTHARLLPHACCAASSPASTLTAAAPRPSGWCTCYAAAAAAAQRAAASGWRRRLRLQHLQLLLGLQGCMCCG